RYLARGLPRRAQPGRGGARAGPSPRGRADMTAGMFDPLANSSNVAAPRNGAAEWRIITPVPKDAPGPPLKHPTLGIPSLQWEYSDKARRALGIVCRFDVEGGGKEIRSLVFAEHKRWGRQWRWLGFPKPRPLYG